MLQQDVRLCTAVSTVPDSMAGAVALLWQHDHKVGKYRCITKASRSMYLCGFQDATAYLVTTDC